MNTKLIAELKRCGEGECSGCNYNDGTSGCISKLLDVAINRIEELTAQRDKWQTMQAEASMNLQDAARRVALLEAELAEARRGRR